MIENVFPLLFLFTQEFWDEVHLPKPTPQIVQLIDQMGDTKWRTREDATTELRKIGKPALYALIKASNHKDIEIAHRARRLVEDYLYPFDEVPTIFKLPPKFDLGENKEAEFSCTANFNESGWYGSYTGLKGFTMSYYKQAWQDLYYYGISGWSDDNAGKLATIYLVKDLLRNGAERDKVKELVKSMEKREAKYPYHYYGDGEQD